ncbi:ParB/Srx family N-terminal domain-containing protein [Caulobacter sp. CCH9-E1]|uniref:ParB/Srx family N-terminal domain-containing protein n=1 Tax=Caulobacter sp. CCH9-E1 TaxID=1768768 RepID=UPI00082EFC39|nr:ParB/Srx family N-terminal domain-containing protein [Caulobacter sp. CCH9-E1]
MNTQSQAVSFAGVQHAEERVYPLGKLKKSPRNVRKVAHTEADIEARAASIKAKGLISPLVVEPELGADGAETGYALVTAGEGRRLALRLLAKRKVISKTTPVRCLVDRLNDPQEVSLDENVSRSAVLPERGREGNDGAGRAAALLLGFWRSVWRVVRGLLIFGARRGLTGH